MEQRLLTTEEVAEFLRLDVATVRKLVSREQLVAYRIAGEYRFMKEDVESFVKSQRVMGKKELQKNSKGPFERFTARAGQVLSLASTEAKRYHQRMVSPEHILLAIVSEGEGVAAKALAELTISAEQIRQHVEKLSPAGEESAPAPAGLGQKSKEVITLAVEEANGLSHHYVGTEHLLLALLRVNALARRALNELGISYDKAHEQIVRLLASEDGNRSSPA
ncbi:helix-turn-helix domain-containing protein [Ktedonosporobacter rubrisoli]|uniref:Helix-turn-helix domain-containing protein n=1 Tax=Ktedonosporobacter rubrisoli TaxID=2509675 RepID=A0A4P6JUF1_KTERU|nr:helix-turn-helix domain-containing protein [Ktedonosporobacter rubrisoli]QBD78965.1 helix-turn-helix domain-containing protein [Ktedonosporobacter rubrisoli]